jgi:VWFA-related protein
MEQSRETGPGRRLRGFLPIALAAAAMAATAARAADPPEPPPVPVELEDSVVVVLAEVQVLVTDKDGNGVTDLKPTEIELREGGKKRRVAFVEPFATVDLSARVNETAVPLLRDRRETIATEESPSPGEIVLPPPPPQRRIVLLFDAYNSRTFDRSRWVQAAHDWVEKEMRDSDRVMLAVMERGEVQVVVPFSGDRATLLGYLKSDSIVTSERYYDYMMDLRNVMDDLQTCVNAYDAGSCALSAVQSYIFEWRTRTNETVGGLRHFAASLAAIPGRKVVFYMSDGMVVDPGEVATQAILGTLGTDKVAYNSLRTTLSSNLHFDVLGALRIANSADVTYFTFDTRRSSMRDGSWGADQGVALHERRGSDPFAVMFDETRAATGLVAAETGGRSYNGPKIEENLPTAVRAMEGLYTIGYYADPEETGEAKVKVKVDRRGVEVSSPRAALRKREQPSLARIELGLQSARPDASGLLVPVVVQVPLDDLTFREDGPAFVADLSLYAEALALDGTRAADTFQMVQVRVGRKEYEDTTRDTRFSHTLGLAVPPGSYRVRVRFSDAEFQHAGERVVDVTVDSKGSIRNGIQKPGDVQEPVPEAGSLPPEGNS